MKFIKQVVSFAWPLILFASVFIIIAMILSPKTEVLELVEIDDNIGEEERGNGKLIIYNWEDYLGKDTLKEFTKRFGIDVELHTFESEDEMIVQLRGNSFQYDLAICSDDAVSNLKSMRLLEKIDPQSISNFDNIASKFRNCGFDPSNEYSIPYLWGTTGLLYNKKFVGAVKSWQVLWNEKYRGKVSLLPEREEVIAIGLKLQGKSLNSRSIEELESARKIFADVEGLNWSFRDSVDARDKMINEELWIAHIYSGEGIYATNKNSDLVYCLPEEGTSIWIDNMVIPKGAKNKKAAEVFINYILEPKVSAAIANELHYANCNKAANEFTDPKIRNNPSLYPSDDVLSRCEFFQIFSSGESKGDAEVFRAYNKLWAELKNRIQKDPTQPIEKNAEVRPE